MNTPEKQRLLRDTIEDADYQQFRASLRRQVLAEYRHRNGLRNPGWLLALAACLAVILTILLLPRLDRPQLTRPAVSSVVIKTVPLRSEQRLKSVAFPALIVTTQVSAPGASFTIVRTMESTTNLLYLSDQELLAIFSDKPVGLVSTDDHTRLLVFVNPDDALAYGNPNPPGSIP